MASIIKAMTRPRKRNSYSVKTLTLMFAWCLLARSTVSAQSMEKSDVGSLDAIIAASYEALSGARGEPRQWDRYMRLLDPNARLTSVSVDAKTGQPTISSRPRETYKRESDEYLVRSGFVDRQLGCAMNQYGDIASVECGFAGLEESTVVERGVAYYQLFWDAKRWWILSVIWEQETPGHPIPAKLLRGNKSINDGM